MQNLGMKGRERKPKSAGISGEEGSAALNRSTRLEGPPHMRPILNFVGVSSSAHLADSASGRALRGARSGSIVKVEASQYCTNDPDGSKCFATQPKSQSDKRTIHKASAA